MFRFVTSLVNAARGAWWAVLVILCCFYSANLLAEQLTLAWDPSTGGAVSGYRLHYGPTSGNYTSNVNVGNQTSYTLAGLNTDSTYYFAVTAYNSTTESGFSNEVSHTIPAPASVAANFSATPTSGTTPLTVTFTDTSTGDITSWSWNFGDNTTSTAQNPSHTYSAAGTYTVSLTVTGPGGSDTMTKTGFVTVSASGGGGSSGSDDVYQQAGGTQGLLVLEAEHFNTSTSQGGHDWAQATTPSGFSGAAAMRAMPEDGARINTGYVTDSPRLDFRVNFVNSGTHYVWLRGLATSGSNNSVHLGLNGQANTNADRIEWTLTNSQWGWTQDTMDGVRATVQVTSPGEHTLNVWMREAGVSVDKVVLTTDANFVPSGTGPTESPTSTPPSAPPAADFNVSSTSGVAPLTVTFSDASSGEITAWSWNFGDGSISTTQNPDHTYSAVGTYTVSLTVSGPGGTNTFTQTNLISVTEAAPAADFSASSTSGTAPLTVNFANTSTGNITGWSWNFGDGNTGSGQSVSHEYNAAGTYTVSLTVTGPGGSDTMTKTGFVTVSASGGGGSSGSDDVYQQAGGTQGLLVLEAEHFNTSTSQGGHDWAQATTPSGFSGAAAMRAMPEDGARINTGYVTDSPRLDFRVNFVNSGTHYVWLRGLATSGSNNSVHLGLNGQANTNADRIEWTLTNSQWGWTQDTMDGVRATVQVTSPGEHTLNVWMREAGVSVDKVVLTTDANFVPSGTGPTESPTSTPPSAPPAADFNVSSTSGVAPLTVTFSDASSGDVTSCSWDFGDGGTATGHIAAYQYQGAGTYDVTLTVTGPGGTDTLTKTGYITVTSPPDPDPNPNPDPSISGLVAAYGFEEGTGDQVQDTSGGTNHGTISGASRISQGRFGEALSFNGSSDWVTINDADSLDLTNGMTLEAWVYPTGSMSSWRTILLKERSSGLVYGLYANSDSNQPANSVYIGNYWDLVGGSQLQLNAWTHLTATYDGTRQRLYINGVEVANGPLSGSMQASSGVLRIGGNSVWPGEFFKGYIDEVRVYNRALTSNEILEDMTIPVVNGDGTVPGPTPSGERVTDGQVLLYTFEEGSGDTILDLSGVGTPLDLTVSNPLAVSWLPGGGLAVNTATTIRSAGAATKVRTALQASQALTLETWVVPANTTQGGPARIMSLSQDGSTGGNFMLGQNQTQFETRLRTTATDQLGRPALVTPIGTATTDLMHLVYTRNAAGTTRFYVNGVEEASGTSPGFFWTWGDYALALASEPNADWFGQGRPWLGELHLVAVYDRALDADEVDRNFQAGENGL